MIENIFVILKDRIMLLKIGQLTKATLRDAIFLCFSVEIMLNNSRPW